MKQIPYLSLLTRIPASLKIELGWGMPANGSDFLSPVIIETWLKEGLIEYYAEGRVRLTEEGKKVTGK